MKLYKFTGEYIHPKSGFGNPPIWHGRNGNTTYASMDDACVAVFNGEQEANWIEGEADDIAWCRSNSEAVLSIKGKIPKAIRAKYSIDEELQANRLRDTAVLDDIAAIVAAKNSEIDAFFEQ